MNKPAPVTRVIVGFFNVNGIPDMVEVPCLGKGSVDYGNLAAAILKRHPKVDRSRITRTGAIIELRDPAEDPGYIDLKSGLTLRQLFDSPDGVAPQRTSLRIGRAFFNGSPVNIMLTYSRAVGTIGIIALPRIKTGGTIINFGNRISPMLLVEGLERLVKEVMGNGVRALELNILRAAPEVIPPPPIKVPAKPPGGPLPGQTRPHTANLPAAVKAGKAVSK